VVAAHDRKSITQAQHNSKSYWL